MTLDPWTLATILAMAAATYLTRAGGYLLFRTIKPPEIVRIGLSYIPGALFVSYVVPALADGGMQQWGGSLATVVVMLATRSLALAILAGTATAALIWAVA